MDLQLSEAEIAWGVWDRLHLHALQSILPDTQSGINTVKTDSPGRSLIDKNFDVLRQAFSRANIDFGVSLRRRDGELDVTLSTDLWRDTVAQSHRQYTCCAGDAPPSVLPWYYSEWSQLTADDSLHDGRIKEEEAAATRRFMLQPLRTLALAVLERIERVVRAPLQQTSDKPTESSLLDRARERVNASRVGDSALTPPDAPIADRQFPDVWFTDTPAPHASVVATPNGPFTPFMINVGLCSMSRFATITDYATWLYLSVAQVCNDVTTSLIGQAADPELCSAVLGAVISDARSRQQRAAAQQALPVGGAVLPMAMMGGADTEKPTAAQAVAAMMERQRALANQLPPLALPLSISDHIAVFALTASVPASIQAMGASLNGLRREIEDFDADLMWDVQPPTYLRRLADALQ